MLLVTTGAFKFTPVSIMLSLDPYTQNTTATAHPDIATKAQAVQGARQVQPPQAQTPAIKRQLDELEWGITEIKAIATQAATSAVTQSTAVRADIGRVAAVVEGTDQKVDTLTTEVTTTLRTQLQADRDSSDDKFRMLLEQSGGQFNALMQQQQLQEQQQQQHHAYSGMGHGPTQQPNKRAMMSQHPQGSGQTLGGLTTPLTISQNGNTNLGHSALMTPPPQQPQQPVYQHQQLPQPPWAEPMSYQNTYTGYPNVSPTTYPWTQSKCFYHNRTLSEYPNKSAQILYQEPAHNLPTTHLNQSSYKSNIIPRVPYRDSRVQPRAQSPEHTANQDA